MYHLDSLIKLLIFAKDTSDKVMLSKIYYEEHLKHNSKKMNNLFKNRPKTLTDTSPKKLYKRQIRI